MLKWIRKQLQQEEGLTLIELIVVVAIIAILAFTITPRVLDSLNTSKLNGARSVANELHSAMERYFVNQGVTGVDQYPILAATATFADMRTTLGTTLSLTNTTSSVLNPAAAATPNVPVFDYSALDSAGTAINATGGARAVDYCMVIQGRDRANTWFLIEPTGITESTGTAPTCP